MLGELDRALAEAERGREIADAIYDPRLQSTAAWTTGCFQALRGDWMDGIAACRRGLERSPNPVNSALARGFLGGAYLEAGDPGHAVPHFERAIVQIGDFRVRQTQGWFTALLGEARVLQGELERGGDDVTRGLKLCTEMQYPWGIAWAQRALGRRARATGDLDGARRHLEEARRTFAGMDARFEIARTDLAQAEVARAAGDARAASVALRAALAAFSDLGIPAYVARAEGLARAWSLGLDAGR